MNPRSSRRRRWQSEPAGVFGREPGQGRVLVSIEGAVWFVEQGGRGDLLFHEATEGHESAGAEPCHMGK